MQEVNLAGVDLNLLPVLDALLRHRHVTRAAADVGLSQPAMSRALARLRELLDDPLLARATGGFVLTPRAQELARRLGALMESTRGLFQAPAFEPAALRRTLRIAGTDAQSVLLAPAIMARLRVEAPSVDLRIEPYGADLIRRLEEGSLDLAFATADAKLPPGAISFPIGDDRLALVMRRGHPAAERQWTLADYAEFEHAVVAIFGDGASDIDARLAGAGLVRRIALSTPHFMAALAAVAATDMITTISRALAQRFAGDFGLVLRDPPFDGAAFQMTFVAAASRAGDPVLAWFSALTREVAQEAFDARRVISNRSGARETRVTVSSQTASRSLRTKTAPTR